MRKMLTDAIARGIVVSFDYDGHHRIAEPFTLGVSKAGNDVLSCYQTEGGHVRPGHDWDLCQLSKISNLQLTKATFNDDRPGYRRGDSRMIEIFAER
jgi:hypothetical protein